MLQLSEQQVDIVYERIRKGAIKNNTLEADLLDHYCCYIEGAMDEGNDFESAYAKATKDIAPNGVKEIEYELFFLINFNKQMSMKKVIFIIGFLSVFLLSTGIMFKHMHWPGANVLLILSNALVIVTMLTTLVHIFSYMRNQTALFKFRSVTGVLSIILIAAGLMFKFFHMPGANIMYGLGTIVFNFIFLPMFFYYLYKNGLVRKAIQQV